jgi:hypothetical protein
MILWVVEVLVSVTAADLYHLTGRWEGEDL